MGLGLFIGGVFGIIGGMFMGAFLATKTIDEHGGTLKEAQASYTRCISDGAPPDNCAKKYLLPEEK